MHTFTKELIIKYPQFDKHYCRHWGYLNEEISVPTHKTSILMRKIGNNQNKSSV